MSEPACILVATDFSAHARHAADRAALVAHETSAALVLLHVMPGDTLAQLRAWLGAGHVAETRLHEQARAQLDELVQRLHAQRPLPVAVQLKAGPVIDELMAEADARGAGLIALGARGIGFMRRLVLGSTAERLMRRTTRPLLVVRQTPHEPYRSVLVALDFSAWSAGTLQAAREVAPNALLTLLTVYQVPYEDKLRLAGVDETTFSHYREQARVQATQRLHALAGQAGLVPGSWRACVVEGEAAFRIVEKEQEFDCDLVAVGKHGTSMTVDLLLGSVTQHLVAEGSGDLLIPTRREA
jgi:nucleotide-binding universal stress UspA family protein